MWEAFGKLELPQQDIERDLPEDVDVFKIDDETTMLYKIVSLSNVSGFDGIPKGKYSVPWQQLLLKKKRNIAIIPGQDHLSIVILPDFMETIESMFQRVQFLFVRFPNLRVLMIQFPGQPGTRYRRSDTLNNKFLAECTLKFFQFLRSKRLWHWKPRLVLACQRKKLWKTLFDVL